MCSLSKNSSVNYPGLLGRAWRDLVLSECPADWGALLPIKDFDKPDRLLKPQDLPVLDFLPLLANQAGSDFRNICILLNQAREHLCFGQTYVEADFGADFLAQYGWIKILGPNAYWHSDQLSSGFLILGDNVTYPQHWHQAEEIYLPLSGVADWYHQDQGWQQGSVGSVIHHASNVKHATRTMGEPMIALYLWRGGDLNQKSATQ